MCYTLYVNEVQLPYRTVLSEETWYNMKGKNKLSLESAIVVAAINGDGLSPQITTSSNYKHWVSVEDWRRCIECANNHGKIWLIFVTYDHYETFYEII